VTLAAPPSPSPARGERLLFQRGDALYVAETNGANVRRLFAMGRADAGVVWSPSPDGRRVAWLIPLAASGGSREAGLRARPVAVFLGDLAGRHVKRVLATNDLRDRQGKAVTALSVGAVGAPASLTDWALDALSFSADGRSLYLCCTHLKPAGGRATFVADAVTGAVIVDGQGRWKSVAPMTQVDARGSLLVGVGLARTTDAARPAGVAAATGRPDTRFAPLLVTDLPGRDPLTAAGHVPIVPPAAVCDGAVARPVAGRALHCLCRAGSGFVSGGYTRPGLPADNAKPGRRRAPLVKRWAAPVLPVVGTRWYGRCVRLGDPACRHRRGRRVLPNVDRFFVIPD
jgi:hypothetical protein